MLERDFQGKLVKELRERFPDSIIFKNDSTQGLPDLTILNGKHWAFLECKKGLNEKHQPNQDYYVDRLNRMSYAAFINPENERKIRNDIYQALGDGRNTRLPESE